MAELLSYAECKAWRERYAKTPWNMLALATASDNESSPLLVLASLFAEAERLDGLVESAADRIAIDEHALAALASLVREQAEDEALWAIHPSGEQPIAEAYLQQELRRLHAAVERVIEVIDGERNAG